MEKNMDTLLFACLRSAFHGEPLSQNEKALFTKEWLPELLAVSKKHDIVHLVCLALVKNGLIGKEDEYYEKCQKAQIMAVYRYEQLNFELQKLCEALEKAEVPFLPLKGSVIRRLYPEPWMRTSCDIDVLVQEADLDKTIEYLVEKCGYTEKERSSRDVVMLTPSGRPVELHFSLINRDRANKASEVLAKVWEYASPKEGYRFWQELSDDIFYFYHIAHMASHFEGGGCGVRPFVDLWLLDNKIEYSKQKRDELLKKGELLTFANSCRSLSRVWLEGNEADAVSKQMQNYILRGGAYGTHENMIVVQQQKKGGRFSYAMSRIILPYDKLRYTYPVLNKHKWLLPFMQVRRWGRLIFCGGAKSSVKELSVNRNVSSEQAAETSQFLRDIGLL